MPSRKTRRSASVRKGGYYSFNGGLATGAPNWSRESEMGDWAVSSRGNNATYGRGRKHRRGTRKHRRRITRKRRGGTKYGAVAASYQGTGSRGIIDVVPVNTKGY